MADIAMNAFKVLTDVAYLYGEATDSSQGKINKSDLLSIILGNLSNINIGISNHGGAAILAPNAGIVFAYDSADVSKYLIYAYIRNSYEMANRIILAYNGINLAGQNEHGTSVITGGDTQICISIKK